MKVQKFIVVAAILILSTMILQLAPLLPSAHACSFNVSTPPPTTITQGSSVTVSGSDTCDTVGSQVTAELFSGACPPSGTAMVSQNSAIQSGGSWSIVMTIPSSLTPGTYCFGTGGVAFGSFEQTVTVTAAPIPEFPLGLAILAIFMMIAYGMIRRKTRN